VDLKSGLAGFGGGVVQPIRLPGYGPDIYRWTLKRKVFFFSEASSRVPKEFRKKISGKLANSGSPDKNDP